MTDPHIASMTEDAYNAATNVAKVEAARKLVADMLVVYPHYSSSEQKQHQDLIRQLDQLADVMRKRMSIEEEA